MERKNGHAGGKSVEASKRLTVEETVAPTHVYVRLGEEQRVKVDVPMSAQVLRTLRSIQKAR